jgi:hypothetical protein
MLNYFFIHWYSVSCALGDENFAEIGDLKALIKISEKERQ